MTHEAEALHVLVIEDDPDARANLRDLLELDGHHVELAGLASEALDRNDWTALDLIILDRQLPDARAETLLPQLRQAAPAADVIIVTGYSDLQGAIAALRQGAADYILKPLQFDALRASLIRLAERRELARAKQRSETALQHLLEAAECMIVILRPTGELLYLSPFGERLTGYPLAEIRGQSCVERLAAPTFHPTVRTHLAKIAEGQALQGFECPILCRDGSTRSMIWNARLLPDHENAPALMVVGQDITGLKHAQDRALQSERLAAIGQMVTGLAHESRNALQRSQACLEMLALKVPDRPEALNLINRVQAAQNHLHTLFEDVRGYAAPVQLARRLTPVSDAWREAWSHLDTQRGDKHAQLDEFIDGQNLVANVDPFRLAQVFRNLFENALAAGQSPVELTIRADEIRHLGQPALRVTLTDNGPGLDPAIRDQIFEPFFTTKIKGTGLGLPIARRIVEAHGGTLVAEPSPPPGTVFVLILPRDASP